MFDEQMQRRVLVADDIAMMAVQITAALKGKGYTTAIASDGEQCLEMVESFKPDLLILDIMMPKVHGIEVLKRLQSEKLGVIVCTAKDFSVERSKFVELGAADVIIKPFEQERLVAKVDRYFSSTIDPGATWTGPLPMAAASAFRHELKSSAGSCRLWGTRGSIPVSEPQFVRHGGNTLCMAIEYGEHRIIFDAGSGIRPLGTSLMSEGPRKIHLFITHTHWDHIQGFPFFTPAYAPKFDITIYGAEGFGTDLKSLFQGQLEQDYFPVQMEDMAANLQFLTLGPDPIEIGDLQITWTYTQHPGATVCYRVATPSTSLAWVPDNEFLKGYTGSPFDVDRDSKEVFAYDTIIEFLSDVDILLHECQYTQDEYLKKIGWGHSSIPNACVLVQFCKPDRWVVVHHDPMHDDDFLNRKLTLTKQLLHDLGHKIEVTHGFDGWIEYL